MLSLFLQISSSNLPPCATQFFCAAESDIIQKKKGCEKWEGEKFASQGLVDAFKLPD
jgi:hypothetical protein